MANAVVSAFKNKQLRNKLIFTILILIVVRFGSQLPIPEIDSAQISLYLQMVLGDSISLLNSFTGGSFYTNVYFCVKCNALYHSIHHHAADDHCNSALEEMQKDGEDGRKRDAKITRYVTLVLAVIEGGGLSIGLANRASLRLRLYEFHPRHHDSCSDGRSRACHVAG